MVKNNKNVIDLYIDPSWWRSEVFLILASAPRLVKQRLACAVLSVHVKDPLLLIKKSSPCSGSSGFPLTI